MAEAALNHNVFMLLYESIETGESLAKYFIEVATSLHVADIKRGPLLRGVPHFQRVAAVSCTKEGLETCNLPSRTSTS